MSQSIAKAIKYLQTPAELLAALKRNLYCADLINQNAVFVGSDTIKYQSISFDSYTLGAYSTSTGYGAKGIVSAWKTLTLSQDKGDALRIDKIVEDEEVVAAGLVTYVKRYIETVQQPAVDTYVFGVIAAKSGVTTSASVLSNTTTLGEVNKAFAVLRNNNVNLENLILYCSPTIKAYLDEQTFGRGLITISKEFNGEIEYQVQMINGAKIVTVPDSRLPSGVQFILVHKNACPVFIKYNETKIYEDIPGFGGRMMEADVAMYYDAFVYDELVKAVYVSTTTTITLTFAKGNSSDSGATSGATGTMTALTLKAGQIVNLTKNAFVLSGYTFIGWSTTNAYDATPEYGDEAAYTAGSTDATLYADWLKDA